MTMIFKKAVRSQRKAKIAIYGPSGSGKTMTALRLASGLVGPTGRIALLDTEGASASMYAGHIDFDTMALDNYAYDNFIDAIKSAELGLYDCLVIDSISHAWQDFLDQHSMMEGNNFKNWSKITPKYNELINAIVKAKIHIIATIRAKTEYVLIENAKGKQEPRKVGMGLVLRPGSEYEFDIVGSISLDHNMQIEKTRLDFLCDRVYAKPGEALGKEIADYLASGAKVVEPANSDYLIQTDGIAAKGKSLRQLSAVGWIDKIKKNPELLQKLCDADQNAVGDYCGFIPRNTIEVLPAEEISVIQPSELPEVTSEYLQKTDNQYK